MHPSIRRAYEQNQHPLSNHPIHRIYGKDMANAQYEHIKQKNLESGGREHPDFRRAMRLMSRIMQTESAHKEELERLAVEVVKKVWNIKDEIDFNADIDDDPGSYELSGHEPEEPDEELTPEEKKLVDKRITLNTMTHGAAIHQMTTMHHLVNEALRRVDTELLTLYDQVVRELNLGHWFVDLEEFLRMMGRQGGEVNIEWPEEESANMKVNATAEIFPILVHELSKGVMEVLTAHGLPQDNPALLKKIYKYADRPEHEILHFLVGPEVWRRFIKAVGNRDLSETIAALATQEPDQVHKIIGAVIDNPEQADKLLEEITSQIEEEGEVDWEDMIDWKSLEESKKKEFLEKLARELTEDPDVAAPVVPPKKKPAPTTPTKPSPTPTTPGKPRKSPFKPPKPAVVPKPKAKKVDEGY
jgi:hypothetical protein